MSRVAIEKKCPGCGKKTFRLRQSGKCGPCTNGAQQSAEPKRRKIAKICPGCGNEVFRMTGGLVCGKCKSTLQPDQLARIEEVLPGKPIARDKMVELGRYQRDDTDRYVTVTEIPQEDGETVVEYLTPLNALLYATQTDFLARYRKVEA